MCYGVHGEKRELCDEGRMPTLPSTYCHVPNLAFFCFVSPTVLGNAPSYLALIKNTVVSQGEHCLKRRRWLRDRHTFSPHLGISTSLSFASCASCRTYVPSRFPATVVSLIDVFPVWLPKGYTSTSHHSDPSHTGHGPNMSIVRTILPRPPPLPYQWPAYLFWLSPTALASRVAHPPKVSTAPTAQHKQGENGEISGGGEKPPKVQLDDVLASASSSVSSKSVAFIPL